MKIKCLGEGFAFEINIVINVKTSSLGSGYQQVSDR